jgi:transmembrane sensor
MSAPTQADREREEIDRAASTWLIRIEEDGLDRDGERDFDQWLASDSRHKATYEAMRATWSDIAEVPGLAALAPLQTAIAADRGVLRPEPSRKRRVAAMAIAASLVAGLFLLFGPNSLSDRQYRTDIAETRIVTLPDGSSVTLGARSSITIAYKGEERRVILSSGEALFDVIHDAQRPFVVDAGSSLIRDLGTRFDVNRTASSVRIGVIEGRVQVNRKDNVSIAPVTVGRGQGVQIVHTPTVDLAGNASRPGQIVVMAQETTGAWRDGRLVFDNVRLADLSADVNRYYAPGVTLGSAAVGDLRVTAAFKTSEIPAFMGALDATLPVRTERTPDGGFRIVDARP